MGVSLFKGVKDVKDKIDDANKEEQQGTVDFDQASVDMAVATTSAEKAAAQKELDAASAEESQGEDDVASTDSESGSALAQKFGLGLVVGFGPASNGLLGVDGTLSVGVGESKAVDIGEQLSDMALTLPEIALNGSQQTDGGITASTNDFTPGSADDLARQMLAITMDPVALAGLGDWDFGAAGVDISGAPLETNLTAAVNIDQTVSVVPTTQNGTTTNPTNASQATFNFTDADTGATVLMTSTVGVDGITLPASSSVTFIPGQTLFLQPPSGFTDPITVTPSLNQYYNFKNQIGLDLEDLFDVKALTADINVEGDDLGPWTAYDSGPDVFIGPAVLNDGLGGPYRR